MKIGIMDSGIGGLTMLKACLAHLPKHEYLYYADSKNAPYGIKTKEEVYDLTASAVDFLIKKNCDIIVIACNTATSAAAEGLRKIYDVPIIGMEPAIKPALELAKGKRVLVTATKLTLSQSKFTDLIRNFDLNQQADLLALTELVTFAEMGNFNEQEIILYLKEKMAHLDLTLYGSVVLGCTHFSLFKTCFEAVFPLEIAIVDGTVGTTNRVKEFITFQNEIPSVTYYLSGEHLVEGEHLSRMQHIVAIK